MCQAPGVSFQKRQGEQGGLWVKCRAEWASTRPGGPVRCLMCLLLSLIPKAPSLLPESSSLWESRYEPPQKTGLSFLSSLQKETPCFMEGFLPVAHPSLEGVVPLLLIFHAEGVETPDTAMTLSNAAELFKVSAGDEMIAF